jgi:Myotubularin-like phosphatase domain
MDKDDITCMIYDMRSRLNAMGNKLNGKGFENKDQYRNTAIEFMGIENIHKARDAHKKICQLCEMYSFEAGFILDMTRNPLAFTGSSTLLNGSISCPRCSLPQFELSTPCPKAQVF